MKKTLRKLLRLTRSARGASRFERYYAGVLGDGSGYPTADEARQDLRRYDHSVNGPQFPIW